MFVNIVGLRSMPDGAFNKVDRDEGNPQDIRFVVKTLGDSEPPKDQSTLRDEVDSTLSVLRNIFGDDDTRFEEYFRPLLSLAQLGLVAGFPDTAHRALTKLQEDIVAREGGGIKNRYMKKLGINALWLGGIPLLVGLALTSLSTKYQPLYSFLFAWGGCMAGVWLSFGARRTYMSFKDLPVAVGDGLERHLRLLFSGLLTITVGLLFSTDVVVVKLGAISTSQFDQNAQIALLIGILSGFSEKVLPSKVARQASSFLDPVG